MSALTDLFTAMANKIRSKTGTATTYTPLQMVSDGIDDVYAAGYDAGGGGAAGIPITPSNASPVSLTTGDSYQMLANGYAISSYNNLSPSNSTPAALADDNIYKTNGTGYAIDSYSSITPSDSSPVSLSSGAIYKMGGAGKAVANVTDVTPSNSSPASLTSGSIYKMGGAGKAVASVTDITPSDSSPASMSSGSVYKAGAAGYAIASSPTSVTPSSSGTYFTSGIKKMSSSGYAYPSKPTLTETTLWTNSSPTSNFAAQSVTLSQSIANYSYIKIKWRGSTSITTESSIIIEKSELQSATEDANTNNIGFGRKASTSYMRRVFYVSGTSLKFDAANGLGGTTGTNNSLAIPTSVIGMK